MIPAAFDYIRAESTDEVVAALTEHGEDAKILAGGHSLLPLMRLRLATPGVLVDIGRIDAMKGVSLEGDHLLIGAATTHQDVIDSDLVKQHCGVLADVTGKVGDPQVRHRGTIGGALAHGDAAGDLPACLLALDGSVTAQGPDGIRTIAAADLFDGYLSTTLAEDEVLTEVRVPVLGDGWGWNYQKFGRVAQAWAIVGSLAIVKSNGSVEDVRIGLTHMGSVPYRASATEDALRGQGTDLIASASEQAAEGTEPPSDLNADAAFRQHLARILTRRALVEATS